MKVESKEWIWSTEWKTRKGIRKSIFKDGIQNALTDLEEKQLQWSGIVKEWI